MHRVHSLLIVWLTAGFGLVGEATAQTFRPEAEWLIAAERSLSGIPFGAPETAPGLTAIDGEQCGSSGGCTYRDAGRVEHYFWDGELVMKSIKVADFQDQEIRALDIGTARSLEAVVERVKDFLPEIRITCRALADQTHACRSALGEGWMTLDFDVSRRLTRVKVNAYQFT